MAFDIKVPVLPESIADATIAKWHKKPGEFARRDENLVDIETDKVVLEVVAPADGMIDKILKEDGTTVKANEVIASFTAQANAGSEPVMQPQKPVQAKAQQPENAPQQSVQSVEKADNAHFLSPSERRAIGEQETKAEAVQQQQPAAPQAQTTISTQEVKQKADQHDSYSAKSSAGRIEKRVPMTRLRARIAERLIEAQQNAAILTTFNEINMAPIIALRNTYKDEFMEKYGVRLGYMSFFVNAVVAALKRFPIVNASIDGNDIVYHGYYDIGIAVSTDRGLVVPILRDADTLSVAEIEQKIASFGKSAREGKLTMDDLTGGTFTITNGGVFGSLMATPILNPPQSGILGMHKIEERPVVENKQVVIRPMMYVALSYDHRIIDGAESVQFLVTVKEMLEDPARLILSI